MNNWAFKNSNYRADIDGLRALAVIAVIINHFDTGLLPGGYLGVDIFFVISGYVITASLADKSNSTFVDFIIEFYARRIKRLVPALVLCVFIGSFLVSLFDPAPMASLRTGLASLFGLSNLYLLKQATNYFGSSIELNVFMHTWSLGVEEQFYLLFPIILWLSGFGRTGSKGGGYLFWIMLVSSFISFFYFSVISKIDQPTAYFQMPLRWWELGVGSLVYLIEKNKKSTILQKSPSSIFILVCIVAVLFIPGKFVLEATIAIILLTSLLIGNLRPSTVGYEILTKRSMVYIGKISYSLYLWHWVVISISHWTIGFSWWSVMLQIALMFLLAISSYEYVESPLRRMTWNISRLKSISYGVFMLFICAIALVYLQFGKNNLYVGTSYTKVEPVKVASPEIDKKGVFVLIGDSHAGHFKSMINSVANEYNMNAITISHGATAFPIINISTHVGGLTQRKNRENNIQMLEEVSSVIDELKNTTNKIIILSSFYQFYFSGLNGSRKYQSLTHYNEAGDIISQHEGFEEWLKKLEVFSKKHQDTPIIIILSTPEMPEIYPEKICQNEWFRPKYSDKCTISVLRSSVIDNLDYTNKRIIEIASGVSNLYVFDPLPSLCAQDRTYCESHKEGVRIFLDEDHLTNYGVSLVSNDFKRSLIEYSIDLHLNSK